MTSGQRETPAPTACGGWRQTTPEPPNGSVIIAGPGEVWHRWDNENFPDVGRWYMTGESQVWDWVEVLVHCDAPPHRLVVVDPTDEAQVQAVARALWNRHEAQFEPAQPWQDATSEDRESHENDARAALRALAGEQP